MSERHPSEAELNDYVDGVVGAAEGAELRRHLESCAECRLEEAELRLLVERAAALPFLAPRRDLWPGIRAAAARPSRGRYARLAIAAALSVIAVGVVVVLRQAGDAVPVHTASVESVAPGAAAAELLEAEREFIAATRKLLEILEQRRERLPPETLAAIERDLAWLDQAISDTREAVAHEPARSRSGQTRAALYQKKMEILWTVSRLSS